MDTGNMLQSKFAHALRTQGRAEYPLSGALPCPYPSHYGRMFQSVDQLYDHAKAEHALQLATFKPSQARERLMDAALKLRRTGPQGVEQLNDHFKAEHTGTWNLSDSSSTPGLTRLSLEPLATRRSPTLSGRKRPAESESYGRRAKAPSHVVEVIDPDLSRDMPRSPERSGRLFDPNKAPEGKETPPRPLPHQSAPIPSRSQRQPGLIELQRYDARYPALLLQPDSRPISQEQLASEVKSIYAGLTMVETKCIHVDRARTTAAQDEPNNKLASDHWQALIALHRTLLHEHHDFFLASHHPSASPALRRLAAKYAMPARMWKHGIHSFLELLRRRLPDSIDYMLAFIYLAYQMIGLLYETVPAFGDTWIGCLGTLGRYRIAVEDENIRDRETWAGVARSWYAKAVDKMPVVGRLYHHLAILAQSETRRWWQSVRSLSYRTINRLEQEVHSLPIRLSRIVSMPLKRHKIVIATCLCTVNFPLVSAANDLKPETATPIRTRTPIFKFDTPFDYTILGLLLLYLLGALCLRVSKRYFSQALHFSYGLMIATGAFSFVVNRDEFADNIRTTVFAVWFTATLHTGAQYCYDNYNPTLHFISFLIAAIVPVLIKMTWPTLSLLDIIPPYLSLIAPLTALAVREIRKQVIQRSSLDDEEQNNGAIALQDRDARQSQNTGIHTGQQSSIPEQLIRRNSNSLRNVDTVLPNLSVFDVGDDSRDAASGRNDDPTDHARL